MPAKKSVNSTLKRCKQRDRVIENRKRHVKVHLPGCDMEMVDGRLKIVAPEPERTSSGEGVATPPPEDQTHGTAMLVALPKCSKRPPPQPRPLNFKGDIDELKEIVAGCGVAGEWDDNDAHEFTYRSHGGGTMIWPLTGKRRCILFGNTPDDTKLARRLRKALRAYTAKLGTVPFADRQDEAGRQSEPDAAENRP